VVDVLIPKALLSWATQLTRCVPHTHYVNVIIMLIAHLSSAVRQGSLHIF